MQSLFKIVLFISLHFSIQIAARQNNTHEFNNIVLSIGNVGITQYEFEKNLKEFTDAFQEDYQIYPGNTELKKWIEEFIEKIYFVAEAQNMGYENNKYITETVDNTARFIVTQPHGLLYNEVITKNISIDSNEILSAYNEANKLITFSYFKFNDSTKYFTFLSKNKYKNISPVIFDFARQGLTDTINFEFNTIQRLWPAIDNIELYDWLFSLKEKEVSRPIYTSEGIYVIQIQNIDTIQLNSIEEEKNNIKIKLQLLKEKKLEYERIRKIKQIAQIVINDSIVYKFNKILHLFENKAYLDKPEIFSDILHECILSYSINSGRNNISVNQFIEFYQNQILRNSLDNINSVYNYLNWLVIEDYYYHEAITLGLDIKKKYILDKQNYKYKVMLALFENEKIMNNIYLSEEDVIREYNECCKEKKFIEEIKEEIYNKLLEKKYLELKEIYLDKLKKKYKIKNNIDYESYLSNLKSESAL